jgi:hypothetical protein
MTLLEVLVCVFVLLLIFLVAFVIPHGHPGRQAARQLKDSSQVRGVLQALVLFALSNNDIYALPSAIDIENDTVPELGTAKDTSASIYSLLMWSGLVTKELLVSPAETGNVKMYQGYESSSPQAAVNPAKALWDPAFRADFTGKEPGGVSYAHMLPGGTRKQQWANTFNNTQVAVSNRGPRINSITYNDDGSIDTIDSDKDSVTYQFHGRPTWTGNIGYNDNHVKFEQSMSPKEITYQNAQGKVMADTIFYDEPDDPAGTNAFLSLFITAGDTRSDFTSIWD